MPDTFASEAAFEAAVVRRLKQFGWTGGVLRQPTEQDLLDNWAHILYENNKGKDRLNGCALTQGEMQQILEQVATLEGEPPQRCGGSPLAVSAPRVGTAGRSHRQSPQSR